LIGFGNIVGPGPHYRVEFDRHPLRLNAVMVAKRARVVRARACLLHAASFRKLTQTGRIGSRQGSPRGRD
jgi:hypothetical protein